ncbi:hypothetical protein [Mycobacterium angelicum]|uniref:Uncharacterized protein n=1 Tax=Mycobacterium angelicum TaxID=470074 RepID=A0A1W9ZZ64_MYCAN|nr:hypothetical protein [Mycobacterium angelicum]MCV7199074.1 hypothetical protein [Mycobacterium angelicum]ORA23022.1 hypothetical protein BST12_08475 [Mycobacterium angelicum]
MRAKKYLAAAGLAAGLLAVTTGVAHADGAAAPVGFWATANGSEQLLVSASGCSLANGAGVPTTSGPCKWNPSSRGGILTIISSQTRRPAPVYFNVVWVNQSTITVEGDVFYRRS